MAGTAIVMISLMQVESTGVVAAGGIEQRMLSDRRDRARRRWRNDCLLGVDLGHDDADRRQHFGGVCHWPEQH